MLRCCKEYISEGLQIRAYSLISHDWDKITHLIHLNIPIDKCSIPST